MGRWKWVGLAAVVGVVAAGVAAQRARRTWQAYDTDALRARLHQRLAEAESASTPEDLQGEPPVEWRRRSHRSSRR